MRLRHNARGDLRDNHWIMQPRGLNATRRLLTLLAFATLTACGSSDLAATCSSDDECFENYVCDTAETEICQRSCTTATVLTDCLGGQYCDVSGSKGVCREQLD